MTQPSERKGMALELWRSRCNAFVAGAKFAGLDTRDRLVNVRVNDAAEVYADRVATDQPTTTTTRGRG